MYNLRKRVNLQPTAIPTQVKKAKRTFDSSPSSSPSPTPSNVVVTKSKKEPKKRNKQLKSPPPFSDDSNGKEVEGIQVKPTKERKSPPKNSKLENDKSSHSKSSDSEEERERIYAKVEIRPVEIDDLAKIWQLGEDLYDEQKSPTLYRTWDTYTVTELFSSDPDYCFVADYKGEVIGFVLGTTISKASWKYGYLIWLGVAKEYQRCGIAKKIYLEIEQVMKAAGVKIIIVDTQADNAPAIRFFEKVGFRNPQKCVFLSRSLPITPLESIVEVPQIEISVREMHLTDCAPVYHLGEQIFTASKAQSHYRSWDEYVVIEFYNSNAEYCLVAETNNKVIGFALGCVIEKKKKSTPTTKHGYITWMGVREKFRRKGVGSALFEKMIKLMEEEGATILLVDTESENKAALNFFGKKGLTNAVNHIFLDHNISLTKRESDD